MRKHALAITVLILASFLWPGHASAAVSMVYFPQTGHHVSDQYGFLRFWRGHGQQSGLGNPITEAFRENGRVVQYFERGRLEYTGSVQVGKIGVELLGKATTGHKLSGEFRQYWETHGGQAVFGSPISDAYVEGGRLIQWFERSRLEYHPEVMRPLWWKFAQERKIDLDPLGEVRPSMLGWSAAQRTGAATAAVARKAGVPNWSPSLWPQYIKVSLSSYRLWAYEGDLLVMTSPIATGKPGFETATGTFRIYAKSYERRMKGDENGEQWDVEGVPFVQYFHEEMAFHGVYWHNSSGSQRSHGCVNLPLEKAEWLYNWTTPVAQTGINYIRGPVVEVVK